MNIRWKNNSIIFIITLVPTCSDGQIKIKIFGALEVNFESNLVKVDKNHQIARVWCRNMKNVVLGWFWSNYNFWSIWPEMALWVLWCPNGLCHVNLDVFAAPLRKIMLLEFSGSSMQIKGKQNTMSSIKIQDWKKN